MVREILNKKKCEVSHWGGGGGKSGQIWVIFTLSFFSFVLIHQFQCCNEASKIFILRRFLAEDPSSSSSSVHLKLSKNLRSFEDFRPKIPKIFGIKSLFVEEILKEN